MSTQLENLIVACGHEIRAELYKLHNEVRFAFNDHLAAFQRSGETHPKDCPGCRWYEGRLCGISEAIRHFGGRVRR